MTIWNTWIGIGREIKQISLRQICFWQICFYKTLRQCWALNIIFKILMRVLSYKDVLWNYYAIQYALIHIQLTYTQAIASYCSENYYCMLHVTHKVPEIFNQITLKGIVYTRAIRKRSIIFIKGRRPLEIHSIRNWLYLHFSNEPFNTSLISNIWFRNSKIFLQQKGDFEMWV